MLWTSARQHVLGNRGERRYLGKVFVEEKVSATVITEFLLILLLSCWSIFRVLQDLMFFWQDCRDDAFDACENWEIYLTGVKRSAGWLSGTTETFCGFGGWLLASKWDSISGDVELEVQLCIQDIKNWSRAKSVLVLPNNRAIARRFWQLEVDFWYETAPQALLLL